MDCQAEETFLYAEITNVSRLGIFVACERPFEVGTPLTLRFSLPDNADQAFRLPGRELH